MGEPKIPKCKCGHEIQDTAGSNPFQGQVVNAHDNKFYKIEINYMCPKCGIEYELIVPFSKFEST